MTTIPGSVPNSSVLGTGGGKGLLDPADSLILLLDHQTGLFQTVKDISVAELRANTTMLAKLATLLKIPVIYTASEPNGPNGPLMPEIHEFAPHAVFVPRKGEVNAWDNEDFVRAVRDTGRKTLIRPAISALAKQALRIRPDLAEAHNNLGTALWQAGQRQEAIEHWQEVLRLNPNSAQTCNNLGSALSDMGQAPQAIQYWERALRIDPHLPEALNNVAASYWETGNTQEAARYYERLVQVRPRSAEAHSNFGATLLQLGKLEMAIVQFEQALLLRPNDAKAYYNLGVALEQSGRIEDAIARLEQALRIQPDLSDAREDLARLRALE